MTYCNHCGDNLVWFSIKPEYESMCILSLSMIVLSWDCRAREPKAEASAYRRYIRVSHPAFHCTRI